jgi:hypothetical protein
MRPFSISTTPSSITGRDREDLPPLTATRSWDGGETATVPLQRREELVVHRGASTGMPSMWTDSAMAAGSSGS